MIRVRIEIWKPTYYSDQYAYAILRKLCKSEIRFGDVVTELFKYYGDTNRCVQNTNTMELYGKYQEAINKGLAAARKEEIHSCIPFIIERIRNEKKN